MIRDTHGRIISYLRIAVTDRCNLRCRYCMPENGIEFLDKKALLSYAELLRIIRVLSSNGINKIRITGGEPFVRKDLMTFLEGIQHNKGIKDLSITTNGTLIGSHLDQLKRIGVRSINYSIDSLVPEKFFKITRRDAFDTVWSSIEQSLDLGFQVKLNVVVMDNFNDDEIISFVKLTEKHPLDVRFLEEMPFNGGDHQQAMPHWNYMKIKNHIRSIYKKLEPLVSPDGSTSLRFKVPKYRGQIGIIPSYSRTFCGTCNRIRLTPIGEIRTCLYSQSGMNLKELIRSGVTDAQLLDAIQSAILHKEKDGFVAESTRFNRPNPIFESMATIGG